METQENIDDWIEKQFAEGLPPEEEERLRRWVQADKVHRDYYDRRVFLYRWLRIQSRIPRFEKEKGKAYRRFLAQVEARRRRLPFGWSPAVWKRMVCAAMLVLALGLTMLSSPMPLHPSSSPSFSSLTAVRIR